MTQPTIAECVDLLNRTANSYDMKAIEHKSGDGWLFTKEAVTLRASIAKLLAADALEPKYKALVEFWDEHNGTPCEQIRHQQELTRLKKAADEMAKALENTLETITDGNTSEPHPYISSIENARTALIAYRAAGAIHDSQYR